MFANIVRTLIFIEAMFFGGMCVWFFMRTPFRSGKIMLAAMVMLSIGSFLASVTRLGGPWTANLAFTAIGYGMAIYGLFAWIEERGEMWWDPGSKRGLLRKLRRDRKKTKKEEGI